MRRPIYLVFRRQRTLTARNAALYRALLRAVAGGALWARAALAGG